MKLLPKILLAILLLPSLPIGANNTEENPANTMTNLINQGPNSNTDNTPENKLATYLLNFGGYFGFDLTINPKQLKPPIVQNLIKILDIQKINTYLIQAFLGAIPVNSLQQNIFLPTDAENASVINNLANNTFKVHPYNTPNSARVTANPLIDQPNINSKDNLFQPDPVNQTTYNLLGTPDVSFCRPGGSNLSKEDLDNCTLIYRNKILNNLIGTIPDTNAKEADAFFGVNFIQGFLSQLNSNSLIAPLRYTSEATTSTNDNTSSVNDGIKAPSQASQAANFIRYASGTIIPPTLVDYNTYKIVYNQAMLDTKVNSDSASIKIKMDAQNTLNTYFAKLRIYAARTSVGASNLYYILAKRMTQQLKSDQGGDKAEKLSQAEIEYNMATHRLTDSKWLQGINSASTTTVQKEIAVLLAEINYQMYLNRQQEERMLLTQSIMQLQSAAAPGTDLGVASPPPPPK